MNNNSSKMILLSSAYLAPIQYYSKLKNNNTCLIEHHENFQKQTYRSRCEIYSPNGLLTLSIPLVKRNHRQTMKDMKISYDYNWQNLHWRSMESSYRRSPFFEYYEDDLLPFYEKKQEYLIDLNEEIQQLILSLLKLKCNYTFTSEYKAEYPDAIDFRNSIAPKENKDIDKSFQPPVYTQVFEARHGFIPNLSIVDLLFNQGPRASDYF